MNEAKSPDACTSLADIRAEIDRLDRDIVARLAQRQRYVVAAARFKGSAAEVRAPDRVEQVVAQVRRLAQDHGASPDVIEQVYRQLIAGMTELEQQHWKPA